MTWAEQSPSGEDDVQAAWGALRQRLVECADQQYAAVAWKFPAVIVAGRTREGMGLIAMVGMGTEEAEFTVGAFVGSTWQEDSLLATFHAPDVAEAKGTVGILKEDGQRHHAAAQAEDYVRVLHFLEGATFMPDAAQQLARRYNGGEDLFGDFL